MVNKKYLILIFIALLIIPGTIFAQGIIKGRGDIVIKQNEEVRGDIRIGDGNVTIYGRVLGNVIVLKGNINLMKNSYVRGDVITYNGRINIEEGAVVLGRKIEFIREKEQEFNIPAILISGREFLLKIVLTLLIFLISFIFLTLFKNFSDNAYSFLKSNIISIFLLGSIIFTIFIYNIPKEAVAPFGRSLYFIYFISIVLLILFGIPPVVKLLGEFLLKMFKFDIQDFLLKDFLISILGTVVILILIIIPLIGNFILGLFAAIFFGQSFLFLIYKIFKSQ
jgi:cytoskeletal protein CcmA (bactofilin family)